MKQIGRGRTFYKAGGKGLSFEDVFGEPFALAKKPRLRESLPFGYLSAYG